MLRVIISTLLVWGMSSSLAFGQFGFGYADQKNTFVRTEYYVTIGQIDHCSGVSDCQQIAIPMVTTASSTLSCSIGTTTITVANATHGMAVGDTFSIMVTPPTTTIINGTGTVGNVISPTSFSFTNGTPCGSTFSITGSSFAIFPNYTATISDRAAVIPATTLFVSGGGGGGGGGNGGNGGAGGTSGGHYYSSSNYYDEGGAGGGGGGGYPGTPGYAGTVYNTTMPISPNSRYKIVIGTGGSAGAQGTTGGNGGTTGVVGYYLLSGGSGGNGGANGQNGSDGSAYNVNGNGGNGGYGYYGGGGGAGGGSVYTYATQGIGGNGGNSIAGGGGGGAGGGRCCWTTQRYGGLGGSPSGTRGYPDHDLNSTEVGNCNSTSTKAYGGSGYNGGGAGGSQNCATGYPSYGGLTSAGKGGGSANATAASSGLVIGTAIYGSAGYGGYGGNGGNGGYALWTSPSQSTHATIAGTAGSTGVAGGTGGYGSPGVIKLTYTILK